LPLAVGGDEGGVQRGAQLPMVLVQNGTYLRVAVLGPGARLAVSPQIPDESLTLTEKHDLTFDVLSDIGSDTAKQYGLAFDLPEDLAAVYDNLGFDLQRVNGGHPRSLLLPATYVIDRDGTIRWAFVNTDYTTRAEPPDVLAALDALV
jgi:peroxiredoxin